MLADVRSGSFASILVYPRKVRFAPDSGRIANALTCPKRASRDSSHRSKQLFYSITSSALASNDRFDYLNEKRDALLKHEQFLITILAPPS